MEFLVLTQAGFNLPQSQKGCETHSAPLDTVQVTMEKPLAPWSLYRVRKPSQAFS
jgi:hypothetical protein